MPVSLNVIIRILFLDISKTKICFTSNLEVFPGLKRDTGPYGDIPFFILLFASWPVVGLRIYVICSNRIRKPRKFWPQFKNQFAITIFETITSQNKSIYTRYIVYVPSFFTIVINISLSYAHASAWINGQFIVNRDIKPKM